MVVLPLVFLQGAFIYPRVPSPPSTSASASASRELEQVEPIIIDLCWDGEDDDVEDPV